MIHDPTSTDETTLPPALAPDLAAARRFLAAHPPRGRLLFAGISGAHLYGFPSPDSDLDVKGAWLAPTPDVLGLERPPDTANRLEIVDGLELDLTLHEAAKLLQLLLRGSGNVLEQLVSPFQVVETPELEALRALARGSLSLRTGAHYTGFLHQKRREVEGAPEPALKAVLYAWRVALTGLHLLRTGEIEPDLARLAPRHGRPELLALVARKRCGEEHGRLDRRSADEQRAALAAVAAELDAAVEASALPPEAPNRAAASDWLTQLRLRELDAPR